jgi:hypothetical protein
MRRWRLCNVACVLFFLSAHCRNKSRWIVCVCGACGDLAVGGNLNLKGCLWIHHVLSSCTYPPSFGCLGRTSSAAARAQCVTVVSLLGALRLCVYSQASLGSGKWQRRGWQVGGRRELWLKCWKYVFSSESPSFHFFPFLQLV